MCKRLSESKPSERLSQTISDSCPAWRNINFPCEELSGCSQSPTECKLFLKPSERLSQTIANPCLAWRNIFPVRRCRDVLSQSPAECRLYSNPRLFSVITNPKIQILKFTCTCTCSQQTCACTCMYHVVYMQITCIIIMPCPFPDAQ